MVKETLGEDAIIVATREEKGGKAVRITAAIDNAYRPASDDENDKENMPFSPPAFEISDSESVDDAESVGKSSRVSSPREWLQYDEEEQEAAITEELTDIMLRHSVPEDVTDMILSCATLVGLEQPHVALIAALEHLFGFRPLPVKAHKKALLAMGPPGAGKTLAIAKMAARAAMNDVKVSVITTDTIRAGGTEQLMAFTKILGVPLYKARTPAELKEKIAKSRDGGAEQILVDTGGSNPFDREELLHMEKLMSVADFDPLLVMPAGWDAEESGEIARSYSSLGVRWMLSTRLDIARRFGGLLHAAYQGGMAFADASDTPQVAEGLVRVTPKSLCRLLMPLSDRKKDLFE